MADKKELTTNQFLKEFAKVIERRGYVGAAMHFEVKPDFVRKVSKGHSLPGPKILKKMKLEPVKEILYRYKEV